MSIGRTFCESLSHRYFLAVLCMWGIALNTLNQLTFVTMMMEVITANRVIRAGACPPVFVTNSTTKINEFVWGRKLQTYILMGYQIGYALGQLPAGLAVDYMGVKTLYGYGVFMPGILSLLTPICARTSPYALLVNRVINGVFTSVQIPSVAYLAARWFPRKNIGFMLALIFLGFPLGCIFNFSIGHQLTHVFHKWASMFYINGSFCVVWAYIWRTVVWEDPFEHPYINITELEVLVKGIPMYANVAALQRVSSWPWKFILTSSSLWTLSFANFAYIWYFYFAIIIVPTLYYSDVHRINVNDHQTVAVFIFVLIALLIIATGVTSDLFIKTRTFNRTHVTKGRYTLSCIVGSAVLIGLMHAGCFITTVFIYTIIAMCLLAIGYTSLVEACLSIAPNYVGVIVALTSMVSDVTAPLEFRLAEHITRHDSVKEWNYVSYLLSAFIIVTVAIFLKWGDCQPQPWNEISDNSNEDVDNTLSARQKRVKP